MKSELKCIICKQPLEGRQRLFCSRTCKNANTNARHQSYACQQERGLKRKIQLVGEAGGCCTRCGYDLNLAALTWHHVNPAEKRFTLDIRNLSNRSEADVRSELGKCILLCANCHAEEHFPFLGSTKQ